jgi:hypothetical protein
MRQFALALSVALAGCAAVSDTDALLSEIVPGIRFSAPTLSGHPQRSGCQTKKCQELDKYEAELYYLARKWEITWSKLVYRFYLKRSELFPQSDDGSGANELIAYQRFIAEQLDAGKITETQWDYLIEKKATEINTRNQLLINSAPRKGQCSTTNVGSKYDPEFVTTCR